MKRCLLSAFMIFTIVFALSSCVIIPMHKNFVIDPAKIASIEIYDLRKSDTYGEIFLEDTSPVYEIPSEEIDDFTSDLAQIEFTRYLIITIAAIDPSLNYGDFVVRINYTDGSFEFLSDGDFGQTFDQDGEAISGHRYGADSEEWEEFIGKYLPEEIMNNAIVEN